MRGRVGLVLATAITALAMFAQAPKAPLAQGKKGAAPNKKKSIPVQAPLDFVQIDQMVRGGAIQDGTIAGLVVSRTVVDLTRDAVEKLREAGAGPLTLAALEKVLPKGEILLRTDGEAEVSLDGKRVGTASAEGELKIDGVDPGSHKLRIAKGDLEPLEVPVEVEANKTAEVQARLREGSGFLDITVFPADAAVAVEGSGSFQGSAKQKRLPVGPQKITVTAAYHTPVSFQVTLASGQTVERTVRLVLDPAEVKRLRASMEELYTKKDWNTSFVHAQHLLKLSPTDPVALKIATSSRMQAKDWENYRKYAGELLRTGGEVELPVTHKHAVGRNHEAVMLLSGLSVRYEPGPGCQVGPLASAVDQAQITASQNQMKVTMPGAGGKPASIDVDGDGNAVQAWMDLFGRAKKGDLVPKRDVSNLVRPAKPEAVYFWDEKGVPLELESVTAQAKKNVGMVVAGATSKVTVPSGRPVFVTRSPQAVNLELYPVEAARGQREWRNGTASLPIQVSAGGGVSRVDVAIALSPGEYCFGLKGSGPRSCFVVK